MAIVFVQPAGPGTLHAFAMIATFVPTADDLFVNEDSLGGVPDVEVFVNGVSVSTDYVILVNGA